MPHDDRRQKQCVLSALSDIRYHLLSIIYYLLSNSCHLSSVINGRKCLFKHTKRERGFSVSPRAALPIFYVLFERLDELIDRLDIEMAIGNKKPENRLTGIEKSRIILERVNDALTVLKKKPEDGQKLYDLIYLTLFSGVFSAAKVS